MTVLPDPLRRDDATRVIALRTQHDPALAAVPAGPMLLRWQVESADPDARQIGYQLRIDAEEQAAVVSAEAVDVPAGTGLTARERRTVAVRIATASGWSAWSTPLRVEAGVAGLDLSAEVIDVPSAVGGPVPSLRREFTLTSAPTRARLYVSALGIYDVRINGSEAGGGVLSPGWTAYQDRVLLETIDVTSLLHEGANAIEITVADGWYRGRMGFAGRTAIYGDRIGALAQLEIEDAAGARTLVATDASWRGGFGALRSASIYDGTVTDLTFDEGDASVAGFDDAAWTPATIVPADKRRFVPRATPPVEIVGRLPMSRTSRGSVTALDSGQNLAGWVELDVTGRRGDVIVVRHAEVLEPDGSLHTAALRTAVSTDTFVLAHDGRQVLRPRFTFHGFRYAEVAGAAIVHGATAVAISSAARERSSFSSSHATLDRFHENVRWSQRSNFVSLPTDCPQRDERLGWTGDAQAFAATANTLFDSESFWESWLRDLEADQTDEGGVASVVPNIIRLEDMIMGGSYVDTMGRAGWADAATIVPLAVYDAYGSTEVLRAQLRSMRRWVAHLRRRAGAHTLLPDEPFQYGDWLDPDAPGDQPWQAKTPSLFVANVFYAHSARLLARAERILGEEAREHEELAARVAAAVWERWEQAAFETQTGAALSLMFDIAPDAERPRLAQALAAQVRAEDGRISTGFLGTPLVLDALSSHGYLAEAYLMLLRRDAPSWLYQVDRGATTVWERWDAIRPDGSIHLGTMDSKEDDSMLSFNHYAYGAVIDWVYRTVAGLEGLAPGYRRVRIAPRPATSLTSARAHIDTPYGALAIEWLVEDDRLHASLVVPFGVTAELQLPTTPASTVTVNGLPTSGTVAHGRHTVVVTHPALAPVAVAVS